MGRLIIAIDFIDIDFLLESVKVKLVYRDVQ
jgi:hypothetical protein